jgi:hypothetical protein
MASEPVLSRDGRTLIAEGIGGQLTVVDLPSLARWTLPVRYEAQLGVLDLSTGGQLVQGNGDAVMLWTLPRAGSDLPAWLEELTNATEVQEVLTWPWLQAAP